MAADPITPPELYFNRRTFMRGGLIAAGMGATALIYKRLNGVDLVTSEQAPLEGLVPVPADGLARGFTTTEPTNSLNAITNYNNFYEFSTDKDGVASAAKDFDTTGWKLEVGGLVGKPRTYDIDDLRRRFPPEERIYRLRCVEAWSMVIPWAGFPISKLLAEVQPLSSAKYVAFETLHDPVRMPNQKRAVLPWPYVEGLRMDEAMNPLAILATGLYGQLMPPQDGAPIRLVVPWKYGFKGIKSIVKITLTDKQPPSTWNIQASREYGFYANVNPTHPHPRWSQATEDRLGHGRRDTLMFNGYGDQVAHLYAGQDLHVDF